MHLELRNGHYRTLFIGLLDDASWKTKVDPRVQGEQSQRNGVWPEHSEKANPDYKASVDILVI
jgi:hypothetical protein